LIQLNAPEELGRFLKEAGITTVRIVPTAWIPNECKEVIVYISIQEGSRMVENIESKFRYVMKEDEKK